MNHSLFIKIELLIVGLLAFQIGLFSQANPDKISESIVQGQSWSYSFLSFSPIRNINANTPSGELTIQDPQNGYYDSEYLADSDFEGSVSWVVEYTDFLGQKFYSLINLDVVKSLIRTQEDFVLIPEGESSMEIDVLSNDFSSAGDLELIGLDLVQNGTASIEGSNITYIVDEGFEGISYLNYLVKDSQGSTASGIVTINVVGGGQNLDKLFYTITNTSFQDILLPDANFYLDESSNPVIGNIDALSVFSFRYSPLEFSEGQEDITFVHPDGRSIDVTIDVINNQELIDFVIDDRLFTTRGSLVAFDPLDNDYNKNVIIIDHSPELSNASGLLVYTPDPGFSGVKNFYYTVHDGSKSYKGLIEIFVGDYLPTESIYNFVTKEATPLVLEYKVPIKNFEFRAVTSPSNGQVRTNLGQVTNACENSTGFKLIEYRPNDGFVGTDEFILEYCVINGACQNITISVTTESSSESCLCFGSDCVWSGDTDNDGQVTIKDLLPVGYNYGRSGASRSKKENIWQANTANEWTFSQGIDVNQKYADSNGDGIVSASDTSGISQNYGKHHNLTADHVLASKDIPINIVLTSSSFNPGDVLTFDIFLGTDTNPITDLQGLTFDVQVPSGLVEPGSMGFTFGGQGLFGGGSPTLVMNKETSRGSMDVGIVKTGNIGVSGTGYLGSTNLTILIDIDGLKPEDRTIPFEISVNKMVVTDGKGNPFNLKGSTIILDLNLFEEKSNSFLEDIEVITFPNPATDIINFHANNFDELQEIILFNTLGEKVFSQSRINSKYFKINVELDQGFYLAHVTTAKGKTVRKIQVIRE